MRNQTEVKSVVFSYLPGEYPWRVENVTVPIAEALDWADAQNKRWSPDRVIWEDGTSSWAKGWWWRETGKIARIGAGAYGDYIVARRSMRGHSSYSLTGRCDHMGIGV
jgi:hypothetical protein